MFIRSKPRVIFTKSQKRRERRKTADAFRQVERLISANRGQIDIRDRLGGYVPDQSIVHRTIDDTANHHRVDHIDIRHGLINSAAVSNESNANKLDVKHTSGSGHRLECDNKRFNAGKNFSVEHGDSVEYGSRRNRIVGHSGGWTGQHAADRQTNLESLYSWLILWYSGLLSSQHSCSSLRYSHHLHQFAIRHNCPAVQLRKLNWVVWCRAIASVFRFRVCFQLAVEGLLCATNNLSIDPSILNSFTSNSSQTFDSLFVLCRAIVLVFVFNILSRHILLGGLF